MIPVKSIDIATMLEWQKNDEVMVVDVREPHEYAEANIPGAILLPMAKVTKESLIKLGAKKWVLHCRSGGRSTRVCENLLSEDSTLDVYNLEGGIRAWLEKVEK